MKKIITILLSTLMVLSLVGCGSQKVERDPVLSEDLNKVLDKVYESANLNEEQKKALEFYQRTELNKENAEGFLGSNEIEFTEGLVSAPMMSSIPYELVLLKLDENADVESAKELIKKNANPRKWVCVEAEEVVVENIDNVIFFMMANKEDVNPTKDAFMSLSEAK